jgi:hypothetical protein
MANSKQSLIHIQARVTNAIAGIQKDLATMPSITLAGVVYTPAALLAILEAYAPVVTALAAAHHQLHACSLSEKALRGQILPILQTLDAFVTNLFGPDPNKLGDFGVVPRKARVESAETRARAVEKARATRAAKKAALAAIQTPASPPLTGSTTNPS